MTLSVDDRERLVDAALAAGLRAIPVAELIDARAYDIEARLMLLAWGAVRAGDLVPVYVSPEVRVRIAAMLAEPDGDALLERLRGWLQTGRAALDA